MRYRLEHASPWTVYDVRDDYTSIEACEVDCLERYHQTVHFRENAAGVLEAIVYSDVDVILRLYEVDEGLNAPVSR